MLRPECLRSISAVTVLVMVLAAGRSPAQDGILDPSFGTGGKVVTEIGDFAAGCGLAVQPDGGMLVCASVVENRDGEFALLRYDRHGDLDASFGVGGVARSRFVSPAEPHTMAVQADGKIVVGGIVIFPSRAFALARFDDRGLLDPSFGTGGMVITNAGSTFGVSAIVTLPDGKLVVGGESSFVGYRSDGALDPSFGNGGVIMQASISLVRQLLRQPDGRLLAVGVGPMVTASIARLEPDGSFDTTFGTGGIAALGFGEGTEGLAVALQRDGRIVGAGIMYTEPTIHGFGVARLRPDGKVDDGFGNRGVVSTRFDSAFDVPFALAIQPDGAIIAAGYSAGNIVPSTFALARYLPNGQLDRSFGSGGLLQTMFAPDGSAQAVDVELATDGKIVAAGSFSQEKMRIALARYTRTNGASTCTPEPRDGCRRSLRPHDTTLLLDAEEAPGRAELAWRWRRGEATSLEAFGDPRTRDAYAFCAYDESTSPPSIAFAADLPAGGVCGSRPCWRALGDTGFVYHDPAGKQGGVHRVHLRAHTAGKAAITVRAYGPRLTVPPLPLAAPLRVQLQRSNGECWESRHPLAGAHRNDEARLRAKAE